MVVGIGLVVFFFLSESAGSPDFGFFCWGTVLLTLAFLLRAQYKKTVDPSGRFSLVKKLMPKAKEDKGKK